MAVKSAWAVTPWVPPPSLPNHHLLRQHRLYGWRGRQRTEGHHLPPLRPRLQKISLVVPTSWQPWRCTCYYKPIEGHPPTWAPNPGLLTLVWPLVVGPDRCRNTAVYCPAAVYRLHPRPAGWVETELKSPPGSDGQPKRLIHTKRACGTCSFVPLQSRGGSGNNLPVSILQGELPPRLTGLAVQGADSARSACSPHR